VCHRRILTEMRAQKVARGYLAAVGESHEVHAPSR
jgi:hypothetical protein